MTPKEVISMGIVDKAKNEAEELKGKGKEAIGHVTDNERLEAEGNADQSSAKAKQAGEHVKDTAHDVKESAKDALD
jgi:uncharacterized protein YjbJ (UPF0337 family)